MEREWGEIISAVVGGLEVMYLYILLENTPTSQHIPGSGGAKMCFNCLENGAIHPHPYLAFGI